MTDEIFEPYTRLIEIEICGKTYQVPENNSILRGLQFLDMEAISYGDFCWNGECLNCQVWLKNGDKEKAAMACRTDVIEGMKVIRMSDEINSEFPVMKEQKISRDTLLKIIDYWEKKVFGETQIHQIAEETMEGFENLPNYPEDSFESIAAEVLMQLDIINQQLITSEDIPAIRKFLLTPSGQESIGWAEWSKYWDNIDFEQRKQKLKNNGFYCT